MMHKEVGESGAMAARWRDVIASVEQPAKRVSKPMRRLSRPKPQPGQAEPSRYYLQGDYQGIYLTERQRQVLILFLRHYTASQIADCLQLSERTIEDYSRALRHKFGVATKALLVKQLLAERFDLLLGDL